MNRDEIATILEEAADLYESEKVGWCQGNWAVNWDGNLSVCAEGAIYMAAGMDAEWLLVDEPQTSIEIMVRGDKVIKYLTGVTIGRYDRGLHMWNDHWPDVTKSDVIQLMKEQAKELRNGPQAPTPQ